MKRIALFITILASIPLYLFSSMSWSQNPNQTQQYIAAGSGVNLGITRLLAEAFLKNHQQISIEIPGSIGSRGAIKAIAEKAITLGLTSRPLKDEEKALGIIAKPYAKVAMIIGVHPSVQDDNITTRELIDIFSGKKTQWTNGAEIIVQAREKSDSGFQILQENIAGFKEVYEESQKQNRWTLFFTDQDANHALSTVPQAIGVADLGMISTEHLPIKPLTFNGIAATTENIQNGSYPLIRELFFVYNQGQLPEEVQAFIDFVFSAEGHTILQANGYLPL